MMNKQDYLEALRRALIAAVALVALVIALTEIYRLSAERGSAHLAATGRATAP